MLENLPATTLEAGTNNSFGIFQKKGAYQFWAGTVKIGSCIRLRHSEIVRDINHKYIAAGGMAAWRSLCRKIY